MPGFGYVRGSSTYHNDKTVLTSKASVIEFSVPISYQISENVVCHFGPRFYNSSYKLITNYENTQNIQQTNFIPGISIGARLYKVSPEVTFCYYDNKIYPFIGIEIFDINIQ